MSVIWRMMGLCCLVVVGFVSLSVTANGNVAQAAEGTKRPGVYFDVSVGNADLLLLRMEMIEKTLLQLEHEMGKVDAVIGTRGGATPFMTRDDHYVIEEDIAVKRKIREYLRSFTAAGVALEQCRLAAELKDIPDDDFIDEMKVVANGYVSLITYQSQGYAVVPMD